MNHSWTLVCLVLGFLALLGLWLDSPSHSPPNTDRELLVKFRQPTWALRRRQVESVQQLPVNNTDIETAVSNPAPPTNPSWKYSQYATIAPDPYRPAKTAAEGEDSSSSSSNPWSKEWGSWSFWDGDEGIRPARRPYADYAYRDVPGDDFDDNAWTVDAVFVNHILDAGEHLVQRAQDAIFAEYGYARKLPIDELLERNKMFRWEKVDLGAGQVPSPSSRMQGGWTTQRSFDGLARRILHAIMTNDEFVVVVVGAPWVAGIGNHFHQSYPMQMHRVLAPVLARLGVKLVTRNLSNRHAGSLQAGLGKLWGNTNDIDLLIWDEGHSERSRREKDLFLRQVLLNGKEKIPVVWMGGEESDEELLRYYHEHADVDVGRFGTALYGIPTVTEPGIVDSLPHAARYLNCDPSVLGVCRQAPDEYCATCWIDRPDIANPKELFPNITDRVPGHYNWNPGWRQHQLTGRLLAYSLMDAVQDALHTFTMGASGGPPLDDGEWHMGGYYENIREKLVNLSPVESGCAEWGNVLPSRVCSVPLQGATQHTPRAGPSITDIMRPGPGGVPNNPQRVMYEGYDVHNACFDPPQGTPDVVGIVSGRRRLSQKGLLLEDTSAYEDVSLLQSMPAAFALIHQARMTSNRKLQQSYPNRREQSIQSGDGWQVVNETPGQCDGEYTSICGRQAASICPLLGHHDSQGEVRGGDSAGWIVLGLENMEHGIVILGLHLSDASTKERRRLGPGIDSIENLPDSFSFDVAIDGKISTWNKEEFVKRFRPQIHRGFDALVVLDEESDSSPSTMVEVGFRLRECGTSCSLGITHVFWA